MGSYLAHITMHNSSSYLPASLTLVVLSLDFLLLAPLYSRATYEYELVPEELLDNELVHLWR